LPQQFGTIEQAARAHSSLTASVTVTRYSTLQRQTPTNHRVGTPRASALEQFAMPESSDVVAVIDDDDLMREALAELLKALGYTPELHASATSFWDAVGPSKARCLLIDVQLGDTCGIGFGRSLAAAGFKFPIIYMTGNTEEIIRRRALDAGCVAFLRKPIALSALVKALNTAREKD
jgi:CheY-like chemotaxis protein